MTVNPNLPVSVSVAASVNPVCAGTFVTYTALPTNGGNNPTYQWTVNSVNITGATNSAYSYIPSNGDIVSCTLTSNATCINFPLAASSPVLQTVSSPITSGFMADNLFPQKYETVQLTDQSTGNPTSWFWSFDRPSVIFVEGTTAASQNPKVQFTDGGLYSVTLQAANQACNDVEVKSAYLRAGISGLWTGNTSTDWSIHSNWDNYLIPGANTDVVIPESASFWPVFTGDLIIGTHCRNLLLRGSASKLTVTGNVTISP
jgi:PKD repeat protein